MKTQISEDFLDIGCNIRIFVLAYLNEFTDETLTIYYKLDRFTLLGVVLKHKESTNEETN